MSKSSVPERRFIPTEIRSSSDGRTIEGYAAKFNRLSSPLQDFRERVAPGAFSRALREKHDVRCLFDHESTKILGRTKSGTLALSEDGTGLRFRCSIPDTSYGRDLLVSLNRGDVSQCSFSFSCRTDLWTDEDFIDENGAREHGPIRTLTDCDLLDVSPCVFPAYPDTDVAESLRAADDTEDTDEDEDDAEMLLARNFPHGLPAEVRSHLGSQWRDVVPQPNRRKRLFDRILS